MNHTDKNLPINIDKKIDENERLKVDSQVVETKDLDTANLAQQQNLSQVEQKNDYQAVNDNHQDDRQHEFENQKEEGANGLDKENNEDGSAHANGNTQVTQTTQAIQDTQLEKNNRGSLESQENQENQQTQADQDNQTNEADKTNQAKQKNRFAHLGRFSQVTTSTSKTNRNALIIVVSGFVLGFILLMTLGRDHHQIQQQTQQFADNNNQGLVQNAEHLDASMAQHQQQSQKTAITPALTDIASSPASNTADTKAMIARRNAPTEMYSAPPPRNSAEAGNGVNQQQAVLAGKSAFAQYANSQATHAISISATRIAHPRYTIASGEFIHAALETAINSNLPGMVRAVVTRPVYAYVGEAPLIPAGSRLVGQYTAMSSNGAATTRVFVIWNRIITPSGLSIMINSPGSDQLGRTGMGADAINHHFFRIFGTATLLSIMGASSANAGVSSSDQPNSADQYRAAMANAFQNSAQSILSRNLSIKPTIHIYQGNQVTVFVAHDLDLYGVLGPQSNKSNITENENADENANESEGGDEGEDEDGNSGSNQIQGQSPSPGSNSNTIEFYP